MKTVIMAGGRGTRISQSFPDIPKPLIPISIVNSETGDGISKPVMEWEIRELVEQGFVEIILTVSYLYDQIINYSVVERDWDAG